MLNYTVELLSAKWILWEILESTWKQNFYETKFVSSTNSEEKKDEQEKDGEEWAGEGDRRQRRSWELKET